MSPEPTDYAHELRAIRLMLDVTQGEMASLLGVTGNSVMRYETARRPVPEPVIRLARHLLRLQAAYHKEP